MTFFKIIYNLQKMNRIRLNRINSNISVFKLTCKKLNRINSNAGVLKRDYSTAQVKEIARKQKQLVRTSKSQYEQYKIECLQKSSPKSLGKV